jgi:hypothetical protein
MKATLVIALSTLALASANTFLAEEPIVQPDPTRFALQDAKKDL